MPGSLNRRCRTCGLRPAAQRRCPHRLPECPASPGFAGQPAVGAADCTRAPLLLWPTEKPQGQGAGGGGGCRPAEREPVQRRRGGQAGERGQGRTAELPATPHAWMPRLAAASRLTPPLQAAHPHAAGPHVQRRHEAAAVGGHLLYRGPVGGWRGRGAAGAAAALARRPASACGTGGPSPVARLRLLIGTPAHTCRLSTWTSRPRWVLHGWELGPGMARHCRGGPPVDPLPRQRARAQSPRSALAACCRGWTRRRVRTCGAWSRRPSSSAASSSPRTGVWAGRGAGERPSGECGAPELPSWPAPPASHAPPSTPALWQQLCECGGWASHHAISAQ